MFPIFLPKAECRKNDNQIDRRTVMKICWQLELDKRLGKHSTFYKIFQWNWENIVKKN